MRIASLLLASVLLRAIAFAQTGALQISARLVEVEKSALEAQLAGQPAATKSVRGILQASPAAELLRQAVALGQVSAVAAAGKGISISGSFDAGPSRVTVIVDARPAGESFLVRAHAGDESSAKDQLEASFNLRSGETAILQVEGQKRCLFVSLAPPEAGATTYFNFKVDDDTAAQMAALQKRIEVNLAGVAGQVRSEGAAAAAELAAHTKELAEKLRQHEQVAGATLASRIKAGLLRSPQDAPLEIHARAQQIILPSVSLKGVPLAEAAASLEETARAQDEPGADRIVVRLEDGLASNRKITLEERNISLAEAVRKLATAAECNLKATESGYALTPK